MIKEQRAKLDKVIDELVLFLEKDFSSRFSDLTNKEDRQLFYLANVLAKLKQISRDLKEDEKILVFPTLVSAQKKD